MFFLDVWYRQFNLHNKIRACELDLVVPPKVVIDWQKSDDPKKIEKAQNFFNETRRKKADYERELAILEG